MTGLSARLVRLQIEQDEAELAALVDALHDRLARTVDWQEWVKRWPARAVVGAFALGLVLGSR